MPTIDQSTINQIISAIDQSAIRSIFTIVISAVLGSIAGIGGAIYKSGKYVQMIKDLKEKNNKLEEDLKERTDKIEAEIKNLRELIIECRVKIDERTTNMASAYTDRKSPIALNDKGEDLLKRSKADKFILTNQQELIEKIRAYNPRTAYDVQENAKKIVASLADDERFNSFKDFAYREGLDLEPIFTVMSIYLRDIALPLLGFDYTQIDNPDPAKKS